MRGLFGGYLVKLQGGVRFPTGGKARVPAFAVLIR